MNCHSSQCAILKFCVSCQTLPCNQNSNNLSSQNRKKQQSSEIIQGIERNFADLLQKQLRILSDRKQKQIGQLQATVSKLKNQIIKLDSRNRLNKENESRLKQQAKRHLAKIKELQQVIDQSKIVSNRQQVKVIKEIVPEIDLRPNKNPAAHPQIQRLQQDLMKFRIQKYELQETNKFLNDKLTDMKKVYEQQIESLKNRILQLQKHLSCKSTELTKINKKSSELEDKLAILSKPTRLNIEPVIIQKIRNTPAEIRTIYIERPVEVAKIVEVQKVVKQFIQPQRPIVNRIIECSDRQKREKCRCQDQITEKRYQATNEYEIRNEQYEKVIDCYKEQRERMLKAIEGRDSDYGLLEKQMRMIERMGDKRCGRQEVEVTVIKEEPKKGRDWDVVNTKTGTRETKGVSHKSRQTKVGSK